MGFPILCVISPLHPQQKTTPEGNFVIKMEICCTKPIKPLTSSTKTTTLRHFPYAERHISKLSKPNYMKKTLLSLFLLTGLSAFAQLPSGSTAPDFTITDINGNSHTLSTYLAQGKTVILDISATWCGPCWAYKQSHKLADLYDSYGAGGSDEVVVIFIEGDPATTTADLYGTGDNTQGNWVAGSPYIIADAANVADLYDIAYFPTLYRICPNGIVTEFASSNSLIAMRNGINNNCGVMNGVQNHASVKTGDLRLCSAQGDFSATVRNYGKNNITSATAVLKENGSPVATAPYSGNMAQYGTGVVNFTGATFNGESDYTVELSNINTVAPFSPSLASQDMSVAFAQQTDQTAFQILVKTDNYPGEISWNMKNGAGTIVASGGPYQVGPGAEGAGGPDANTTKVHDVTLSLDDCYSITLIDGYGDGWSYGNTPHGIEVKANGATVYELEVGNFGLQLPVAAAFKTVSQLGTIDNEIGSFSIYPNPSDGLFTFATSETVGVTVTDLTGKTVYRAAAVQNGESIDLTSLQRGIYLAKVTGATTEKTEKLVIK